MKKTQEQKAVECIVRWAKAKGACADGIKAFLRHKHAREYPWWMTCALGLADAPVDGGFFLVLDIDRVSRYPSSWRFPTKAELHAAIEREILPYWSDR